MPAAVAPPLTRANNATAAADFLFADHDRQDMIDRFHRSHIMNDRIIDRLVYRWRGTTEPPRITAWRDRTQPTSP
jgi:hypothetical protein